MYVILPCSVEDFWSTDEMQPDSTELASWLGTPRHSVWGSSMQCLVCYVSAIKLLNG